MVLGTILIIVVLANVILSIILSQTRLTHHQISRIQAYYAALGGMNYALDMLRRGPAAGGWDTASCPAGSPCPIPFDLRKEIDADFWPPSINSVSVIIKPTDADPTPEGSGIAITGSAPVIVAVDYAYNNP